MDHLRVIRAVLWFCVGLLIAAIAVPSFASGEVYRATNGGTTFATLQGACDNGGGVAIYTWRAEGYSGHPAWDCKKNLYGTGYVGTHVAYLESSCSSPYVVNQQTGICGPPTCPDGGVFNTALNACQGAACPSVGTAGADVKTSAFTSLPDSVCVNGCRYSVSDGEQYGTGPSATYVLRGLQSTSAFCNPGSETASAAGSVCPAKQCPGTVNGASVCVACSDAATGAAPYTQYKKTTETTTSGGTTTSTTTKTSTTTDGDTVSTSSTTTGTSTTGGRTTPISSTSDKKQDKDDFCAANPSLSICTDSKWSASSCDAAPSCSGDAVQCAQALAAYQAACHDKQYDETTMGQVGIDAVNGADAQAANMPWLSGNVIERPLNASIGARMLTASCLPPVVFSVLGQSFTFDTDQLCSLLELGGHLLVAAASIAAIRIVGVA